MGSAANGFVENSRKYQGNEYIKDLGLNWMDFNNRQYDPQLGRFIAVDPLADIGGQEIQSPYSAMGNNPGIIVDPDGTIIRISGDVSFESMANVINSYFKIDDLLTVKTSEIDFKERLLIKTVSTEKMTQSQKAFYGFLLSMIRSEKYYDINVTTSGNEGDPFASDNYFSSTVFTENIQANTLQKYFTAAEGLYHFLREQKFKQDRPGSLPNYEADHSATVSDMSTVFGYKVTRGYEYGNNVDLDILSNDNKYITTVRSHNNQDGTYDVQSFTRKGVNVGDSVDPKWQDFSNTPDRTVPEQIIHVKHYFEQNPYKK